MGVYFVDNMFVIIEPKVFHSHLDSPKGADKRLKHEIEHIIRQNKLLAEKRIKGDNDLFLYKYKHGNDIHEHKK